MSHFVYILLSIKSDIYYVGQSADIASRLVAHNYSSSDSFTSKHRPWSLFTAVLVPSRSVAVRLEKYLKKKNRQFLFRFATQIELQKWVVNKYTND